MSQDSLLEDFVDRMVAVGAISIRDVDAGETPFLYSSGNFGPGYLMVKGLVSQRKLLEALVGHLAYKVLDIFPDVEYVAGNATGGMVPAWIMAGKLSELLGREVPYFYVRNTRKKGGHNELLTGDKYNDFFVPGRRGLVLEELVNFAETTCNSALVQREAGFDVRFAAAIASYDQPKARELLRETDVELIELLTIKRMLESLEDRGTFQPHLIASWKEFLASPMEWQRKRGITPNPKEGVQHG